MPETVTAGPLVPPEVAAVLRGVVASSRPVFIDLLLDGRGLVPRTGVNERPLNAVYVLLEYDRAYLFHDAGDPDAPCVECFVRHAIDNHVFPEVEDLRAAYEVGGYRTTFAPGALALVGPVLEACGPGDARVVLPNAGEVLACSAFHHPSCRSAWHPRAGAGGGRLRLEPRPLGPGLREGRPDVSDLVSVSGLIRREAVSHSRSGIVSCVTESARHRGRREEVCGGAARTPDGARLSARCESVERFQATYEPSDSGAFPATVADAAGRYAERHPDAEPAEPVDPARFHFSVLREPDADRYTPATQIDWTTAYSVTHDAVRLVPAQLAWMAPRRRLGAPRVAATTNGCALGGSIEEAGVHAVLELVERDGFVTSWLLRRPCRPVDTATVEDPEFHLLLDRIQLVYPTYELHFLDTTTDLGVPSVWLLAVRPDGGLGPKSLTTGGAGFTAAHAMRSALRELAGLLRKADPDRPEQADEVARGTALLADPTRVDGVSDHGDYYATDPSQRFLRFLDGAAPVSSAEVQDGALVPPREAYDARDLLRVVADRLGQLGGELLLKDLSMPSFRTRGLVCVRALATDLFPVSFGYDSQRVSVTPRLRRLARRYGVPEPASLADLNPDVHPFA